MKKQKERDAVTLGEPWGVEQRRQDIRDAFEKVAHGHRPRRQSAALNGEAAPVVDKFIERLEVLQSIAQLTTSATAMSQVLGPQAMPVFVELAKWAVGSLRGSATIEGVLYRALQQAQEAAQRAGGQPLGPRRKP